MNARALAKLMLPVAERDHIRGVPSAAVTLVEYGDFECPHCGHAYPMVEELIERFAGTMRFVFRNFPLSESHPHAEAAAEAAEAAGAQHRFWEMHHALFTHQNALGSTHLVQYAGHIGLDVPKFSDALSTHEFRSRVREDFMSGVRSGVNGTPTFFLNGVRYDGPYDLESLAAAIEETAGPAGSTEPRA